MVEYPEYKGFKTRPLTLSLEKSMKYIHGEAGQPRAYRRDPISKSNQYRPPFFQYSVFYPVLSFG